MASVPRAAVVAILTAAASCSWPVPIGVQDAGSCSGGGGLGGLGLDPTFGTCGAFVLDVGGVDNVDFGVHGIAAQEDGRIVAVGIGGTPRDSNFLALRLLENGALDFGFGDGGLVEVEFGTTRDLGEAIVVQPDGKLLLAGQAGTAGRAPAIARLLPDGSTDPAFLSGLVGLGNQALFNGVVVLPDGRIRAAGQGWRAAGSDSDLQVHGLLADGRLETGFASAGLAALDFGGRDDFGAVLARDASGRLLVPGNSDMLTTNFDFSLGRLLESGLPDPSFGDGGRVTTDFFGERDSCAEVVEQPDGKILCGGMATRGGVSVAALVRSLEDGTADLTFGVGGKVVVDVGAACAFQAVKVLPDGRIVAGGWVRSARGDDDLFLATFSSSGAPDTSEGPATLAIDVDGGSQDSVHALLLDGRGRLLIYGSTASRPDSDLLVMRLASPSAGQPTSAGYQVGCASAAPHDPGVAFLILAALAACRARLLRAGRLRGISLLP